MRFGWVGADAGYGSGPDFLFALADAGHTFLIDIHKSFVIYELDRQLRIQEPSSKGHKARPLVTAHESLQCRGVRAILLYKRLDGLQCEGNDSGLTETSGST